MVVEAEIRILETCPDCDKPVDIQVLSTPAGWYIGQSCCMGPLNRLTNYYINETFARADLEMGTWRVRTNE